MKSPVCRLKVFIPERNVTMASGAFEQSLDTIFPFRNSIGPVVPGLGGAGFGAVSVSSSSPELETVVGALAAPAGLSVF